MTKYTVEDTSSRQRRLSGKSNDFSVCLGNKIVPMPGVLGRLAIFDNERSAQECADFLNWMVGE